MPDTDTVVFIGNGGLGKCIAATVVARNLRRAHADVQFVVVSPHTGGVDGECECRLRYFPRHRTELLRSLYPRSGASGTRTRKPYRATDYLAKRRHLIDVWWEQCGVECDELRPEINLFEKDRRLAARVVGQLNKPLMLIQSVGGSTPERDDDDARFEAEQPMQKRSLPHEVAQAVVDRMRRDYVVVQIRDQNQRIPRQYASRSRALRGKSWHLSRMPRKCC